MGEAQDQFSRWQKIILYLRRLRHWFYRLRAATIFLAVIVGWMVFWRLAGVALGTTASEASIQRAGVFLRLTGMSVLLWRVGLLQVLFDETPWWLKPWAWVKDFPMSHIAGTLHPQPIVLQPVAETAEIAKVQDKPQGLEERIERLESELDRVDGRIEELQSDFRQEIEEIRNEFEEYQDAQKERLEQINSLLEKVSIGGQGLTWELMALGWLLVGILLANEPGWVVAGVEFLSLA